ncbi:membrane integrity-associated transporter subunit PqiC [uncultured Roseobacter sp.]|uniref:PqiC family protein n=1 Tax=uncultured Roseobacter sp. TaxID=114847 RepID=UPI00261C11FD|nr:ABC-type transport auxiliary lipoprotein family protein [uncultured Roseobacter sp.]
MKTRHLIFIGLALVGPGACTTASDRYAVPAVEVAQQQRIAFRSVEVREVSLPAYAASDEITTQAEDGRLASAGNVLWADTPGRAVALELSRHLAQITGARVASAPWPFETFADAMLDVRFERLVAGADGQFRATGQYFVGVTDGRRERSGFFDLTVPFDPAAGPGAIAAARGQIVADLAAFVARDGLR